MKELYEQTLETDRLIIESHYNLVVMWEKEYVETTTNYKIKYRNQYI